MNPAFLITVKWFEYQMFPVIVVKLISYFLIN